MRRSVLHTCLVVLVTFLAFADAADQNTITYDNKTTLERTTLKEQQNIHDDVLRHITAVSTTASSSLSSDVSSKPYVTTVNKLLTTPRSIAEEEQLQKIVEDTDTTTKSNNEGETQIHEKYERKLTINETGGVEVESSSPHLTNKTSANEVIDIVTYKYNESGPLTSVSSYVTVSHTSSYEHSSSVLYDEDDEVSHLPAHHPLSTTPGNDGTDHDENDNEDDKNDADDKEVNNNDNNSNGNNSGINGKNYVNNNEQSRGLLKEVVPVIDLNTSITDKKYTINNVNNDVTVNNKLRPDALDELESTTNFSISSRSSSSSSSNSSNRSNLSKGIISLENVNSTYSNNGDSVNQSINSIINSNNVNIDEHTTPKPRLRYSVRNSEENMLSNISYNGSNKSGLQSSSTSVPNLIKLDTINTVPVLEWERLPNIELNSTDVNSTSVSNNTVHSEVPSSVTQLPSISAIVKPSVAFKNKLRLHPTIRIKTTASTMVDSSSEMLTNNSSNESTSEEQFSPSLNGKYNINSTIKGAISTRKRPPKYYYLSQSNSSDLIIPPTATAWALATMLDNNPRVMKKSSPVFTTAQENLKNDTSSEKLITTSAPRVKTFIPWSTRLQKTTTESTVGEEDTADKSLHTDSDGSSTSNVDSIRETTQFNTAEENTTQTVSVASSTVQSTDYPVYDNTSSNVTDHIVSKNITKADNSISDDQSSVQPHSSSGTTEISYINTVSNSKAKNDNSSSDTKGTQTSTHSDHTKSTDNRDTLSLDSHMTTAQYYGSSESAVPLVALPSSPAHNGTKNNIIDKYDFHNRTELKTPLGHGENNKQTRSNLLFDMNQTSNEIRSNDTLKFKTPLLGDVIEGETKSNSTVNNEPAEVMTEDTILDSGLQANEDSEEDTKNNETTVIQILDLPLETTTNPEVIGDEDGDNEDEDFHNVIAKTTTPADVVNHDMNIADFDSNEETVDDKKLNKDTVETNEDKVSNKNRTIEATEKPSNMDINWYNVIPPAEDAEKAVTNTTTQAREPVTTSEIEHPQTTPVIIITTSTSSSETPVISTTTATTTITTTTVKAPTVADTTTGTTPTTTTASTTPRTTATPSTTTTTTTTTTTPTTITTTTTPTTSITTSSTTTPSTTTVRVDESLHIVEELPAYISIHVETSLAQLCQDRQKLKQAIVSLFRNKSERRISERQVIMLNVNKQQCMNVTKLEDTVLPVNILLVDEAGRYDTELMDKFLQLFKDVENSGFDMYFTVHKVGLVMQRMGPPVADKGSVIAAITLSFIAATCLLLLGILLVIIRKRQRGFSYGQRCTPVSLDDYSLDNISVYNSVRRKGAIRASKRSYGNPAFDDPGAPSHSMNFAGLANFSSDIEALHEEFNQIPMITVKPDELPPGAETKNRYANVIPLPETRVQLVSKEGCDHLDEYINANFVKGPKGVEKFYIACQAPLQSTVNDFWRMIWHHQCKVILMLTGLQENGVEKCADYLPPCEVLDCHRLFGDFQVTLKKREEREKYVISSLQLKNLETNSWREVMHLWYASWPTQGVPEDCSSIIAFLIEARSFMRSTTGPTVVHCSPGTGRTGTVIAIDICIRDFETTRSVDIPKTVYAIRRDRAGAVQTKDQYTFIYQVLNLYAAKLTGGALDSF